MPATFKTLGQSRPAAGVLADAYTAPTGGNALVSTVSICNTGDLPATVRLRLAPAAAADADVHAIYHDVLLGAGDTMNATLGMTLGAGDVLRVLSSTGTVSFTMSGQETTP